MNLTQVVNELRDEQQNAVNHSKQLGIVITALETLTGRTTNSTRATSRTYNRVEAALHKPGRMIRTPGVIARAPRLAHARRLSAAGRRAIAAAQKARWAKQRGMGVVSKRAA